MKKVVYVTGGTSGIGLGVVSKLINEGNYQIVLLARSEESKLRVKESIGEDAYVTLDFVDGDIEDNSVHTKVFEYVKEKYGRLDGIVNGLGVSNDLEGIENTSLSTWENILHVNLTSVFMSITTLLPLLKESKGASVVNISSVSSKKECGSFAYGVAKAGVDKLTKNSAVELAKYNIRVNAVNPGLVRSNFLINSGAVPNQEVAEMVYASEGAKVPLGRVGNPEDVAELIEFLLSSRSSLISGTNISVDGAFVLV